MKTTDRTTETAACPPKRAARRVGTIAIAIALCLHASPRAVDEPKALDTRALTAEIDQFLIREATAHFAGIPTLDPPPDRVLGARTVGEFSWGTFMRALAAIAQHAHAQTLADRDVPLKGRSMFQFRIEATNVFNIVNLNNPGTTLNALALFGKIRSAKNMRQIQLGGRVSF